MKFTTRVKEWLRKPREFKFNPWLHGWPTSLDYKLFETPVCLLGRRFVQNNITWEIVSFAKSTKVGADPDNGTITAREVK